MRKTTVYLGVFFWLAGLSCLASFPVILCGLQEGFKAQEPYFNLPVYSKTNSVVLRSDAHGKGYFGAPRDGRRTHQGIDILTSLGDPVFASKSGRVLFTGWGKGYGRYVEIRHPDGLRTRYAHLRQIYATQGDWVKIQALIGACGKTGNAANPAIKPHVHFEILASQGPINPSSGLLDPSATIRNS